jgi:hypothetical protein
MLSSVFLETYGVDEVLDIVHETLRLRLQTRVAQISLERLSVDRDVNPTRWELFVKQYRGFALLRSLSSLSEHASLSAR